MSSRKSASFRARMGLSRNIVQPTSVLQRRAILAPGLDVIAGRGTLIVDIVEAEGGEGHEDEGSRGRDERTQLG